MDVSVYEFNKCQFLSNGSSIFNFLPIVHISNLSINQYGKRLISIFKVNSQHNCLFNLTIVKSKLLQVAVRLQFISGTLGDTQGNGVDPSVDEINVAGI